MERDPRVDPRPGDVLDGGDPITVKERDRDGVIWCAKSGYSDRSTLPNWQAWAKSAAIMKTI